MSDRSDQSADSSFSSGSLVSRHVFHLQRQVTALQDTQAFTADRCDNLESISASHSRELDNLQSLPDLVQRLLQRVAVLEDLNQRQAAQLEVQSIAIARLSRRLQEVEGQQRA